MQFAIISISFASCSKDDSTTTPTDQIPEIPGYTLVWNDEFDKANIDLTNGNMKLMVTAEVIMNFNTIQQVLQTHL